MGVGAIADGVDREDVNNDAETAEAGSNPYFATAVDDIHVDDDAAEDVDILEFADAASFGEIVAGNTPAAKDVDAVSDYSEAAAVDEIVAGATPAAKDVDAFSEVTADKDDANVTDEAKIRLRSCGFRCQRG